MGGEEHGRVNVKKKRRAMLETVALYVPIVGDTSPLDIPSVEYPPPWTILQLQR